MHRYFAKIACIKYGKQAVERNISIIFSFEYFILCMLKKKQFKGTSCVCGWFGYNVDYGDRIRFCCFLKKKFSEETFKENGESGHVNKVM